jgi:hypothetical protein
MSARENLLPGWVDTFIRYNAAYLITVASWMAWMGLIVGWSIVVMSNIVDEGQRCGFPCAQYFTVSVCLSAGSLSLPPDSPEWAYLFTGVFMMVGMPLMALAMSCIVIMMWQDQRFCRVHNAVWEPITDVEMRAVFDCSECNYTTEKRTIELN